MLSLCDLKGETSFLMQEEVPKTKGAKPISVRKYSMIPLLFYKIVLQNNVFIFFISNFLSFFFFFPVGVNLPLNNR